mgnify:FL=1
MSLLNIKNYSMSFRLESGIFKAINNISLKIENKQMVALVGESGCGKSMTAMSILRLLPKNAIITSGEILFRNQNLLTIKERDMRNIRGRSIALIPQDPMTSLNPLYTIGNQLLEVILKDKSLSKQDATKKAIEVLDIVRIPNPKEKLTMYPHEFSGGMKQRAIIAMALATNAELIIADEPTTALDVTIQAQIMNILNDIKENLGTSILLISHDLNLVGQYSDEINVMYSGQIVEKAPSKIFFEKQLHPYSTALLNSLPANNTDSQKLYTIDGQPPNIQEKIEGCRFNPRCAKRMNGICTIKAPSLKEIEPNHFVECFLYEM